MKIRATIKVIIFESDKGQEMLIKQGVTNLKVILNNNEVYCGNVMNLCDDRLTLLNNGKTKVILFGLIKEVYYWNPEE